MTEPINPDLVKMIRSILKIPPQPQSCGCRPNSPDACEKCTDEKTGEKFADHDTKEETCPACNGTGDDRAHQWPDKSFASCETCDGYRTIQS